MNNVIKGLVFLVLLGCSKPDDCFTISEKISTNNTYYFVSGRGWQLNEGCAPGTQAIVSRETYNAFALGDKYCNE